MIPTPSTSPDKPKKSKTGASIARYGAGIQPPATVQHDIKAEAYRRGAADALRSIIIAAQASLTRHEEPQP